MVAAKQQQVAEQTGSRHLAFTASMRAKMASMAASPTGSSYLQEHSNIGDRPIAQQAPLAQAAAAHVQASSMASRVCHSVCLPSYFCVPPSAYTGRAEGDRLRTMAAAAASCT